MKRIFTSFLVMMVLCPPLWADETVNGTAPLVFDSDEWDFGTINEEDGIVTHVFRFANVSDKPIRIISVSTSCGCTNAAFSTEPVASGDFGEITIHFSPARTEGQLYREVEVFTDNREWYNRLTIIANVIPMPMGLEQLNPHQLSSMVRTNTNRCNFGYIAQGQTVTKTVSIVNIGKEETAIEAKSTGNRYGMTFQAPEKLGPEETAKVSITYTIPKGMQYYGNARDTIWIMANGQKSEQPIIISALRVDNFEGTANLPQPVMRIEPSYVDFDKQPAKKTCKQTVVIGNTGKSDLLFRNIETIGCSVNGLNENSTIRPGQEKKVTVSIKSPSVSGESATGSIFLTTTDPTRPLRELRVQVQAK